ncbi:processed acidic surface protein [Bacillus sp. AK031]
MKNKSKKSVTAVLATSLALGTAPTIAGAVDLSEVNENYAGVLDWTEEDWNLYLDENFDTSLDDYDTVEDLENRVGPVINIDELANGNFNDANILEMMERNNMDSQDLAEFLENNDGSDNIHFIGDLENALSDEGIIDPVDISDGDSEYEDVLDMDLLDENYLTPLNWTEEEFNNYLGETYDMELADFTDFEDLETTVGPLLDDNTLDNLLADYGLTETELAEILETNDETLDNFYFISDLENTLDDTMPANDGQSTEDTDTEDTTTEDEQTADDTNTEGTDTEDENMTSDGTENGQAEEDEAAAGTDNSGTNNGEGNDAANTNGEVTEETENGAEMPVTATSAIENIMIGTGVALIGAAALIGRRTRQGEQ